MNSFSCWPFVAFTWYMTEAVGHSMRSSPMNCGPHASIAPIAHSSRREYRPRVHATHTAGVEPFMKAWKRRMARSQYDCIVHARAQGKAAPRAACACYDGQQAPDASAAGLAVHAIGHSQGHCMRDPNALQYIICSQRGPDFIMHRAPGSEFIADGCVVFLPSLLDSRRRSASRLRSRQSCHPPMRTGWAGRGPAPRPPRLRCTLAAAAAALAWTLHACSGGAHERTVQRER